MQEPSFYILYPLVFLAFGSIFIGYWGKEVTLSNMIHPIVPGYIKTLPLILSLLGGVVAFFSLPRPVFPTRGIYLTCYTFLNSA